MDVIAGDIPVDAQPSAIGFDPDGSSGQSPAVGGHEGGTGPGTTGQGHTGPAFEHPQPHFTRRSNVCETDIHPFGEQWMCLDECAQTFNRQGVHVVDKKHDMRIAHIHRTGVADPIPLVFGGKIEVLSVHGFCEGDGGPIKTRFAHIDGDVHGSRLPGEQSAPIRVKRGTLTLI